MSPSKNLPRKKSCEMQPFLYYFLSAQWRGQIVPVLSCILCPGKLWLRKREKSASPEVVEVFSSYAEIKNYTALSMVQ
jgi:hypothetical protein